MHGQQNIQICGAKEAMQVHQYKNTKIKLYKSNAAIWYNKTSRIKQLIPTYVNIRVNVNNIRCQRTKNAAIRYRINQEVRFQYAKKETSTSNCIKFTRNAHPSGQLHGNSFSRQQIAKYNNRWKNTINARVKNCTIFFKNNRNNQHHFGTTTNISSTQE